MMNLKIQGQRALHGLSSALALTAQRLPFLKHLSPILGSPASLRVATPLAVSFAGTHSLSGQSVVVAPAGTSENPVVARVGEIFTWEFQTIGRVARSYTVTGEEEVDLNYSYGIITSTGRELPGGTLAGIPNSPGEFEIEIIGWRGANENRDRTPTYTLRVSVEDDQPITPFRIWREQNWTASQAVDESISGPLADPDNDGLLNVLEYFLNLNPKRDDVLPGEIITAPDDESAYLYELPMNAVATDVNFRFQRNSGLEEEGWQDIIVGPEIDSPYDVTMVDGKVQLRFPKAAGEFIRLVVTLN